MCVWGGGGGGIKNTATMIAEGVFEISWISWKANFIKI